MSNLHHVELISADTIQKRLAHVARNDPIVHALLSQMDRDTNSTGSATIIQDCLVECICMLVEQNAFLKAKVADLFLMQPKTIVIEQAPSGGWKADV